MALQDDFEKASLESKQLPEKPSDDNLLKIYALFKQSTMGDVSGERPGIFDFVAGAKYDAWEEIKGQSKEQAMQQYIALINKLKG
jgi:acyl-CoA-binding protein